MSYCCFEITNLNPAKIAAICWPGVKRVKIGAPWVEGITYTFSHNTSQSQAFESSCMQKRVDGSFKRLVSRRGSMCSPNLSGLLVVMCDERTGQDQSKENLTKKNK